MLSKTLNIIAVVLLLLSTESLLFQLKVVAKEINVSITVDDTACFDGVDNDSDGKIDFPDDPGCSSNLDDDETDIIFPACSDNTDNDGDGKIDFPDDLGCDSASDDDESDDPPLNGSGGGGGGGNSSTKSSITLEYNGWASPHSTVVLLIDGAIAATTSTDVEAKFSGELSRVPSGIHTFAFYSIDTVGLKSPTLSTTVNVRRRSSILMADIFLPPTTWLNKTTVLQGDRLIISGETVPLATVVFEIDANVNLFGTTSALADGTYRHAIGIETLSLGTQGLSVHSTLANGMTHPKQPAVKFIVGNENILAPVVGCQPRGDLNKDCRVNLIDFSILLHWWPLTLSEDFLKLEKERLSGDGRMSLVDFSVIAYYWTG
jgi:hypothetical protein